MPLITKFFRTYWPWLAVGALGYMLWAGGIIVANTARAAGPIFDNSATVPYDYISGDTILHPGSWYSANENITRLSIPVKNVGASTCHMVWDSRLYYGVGLYKSATVEADINAGQIIAATFDYPSSPSVLPSAATSWLKYYLRSGDTCGSNAQAGRIYTVDETDTLYYTGTTNRVAAAIVNGGTYPVEEPDPKETPFSYITKPTIAQTYAVGADVYVTINTEIPLGTASSPIDYQFKLEQYVNEEWTPATVANYNGELSTTGTWTYQDPNASQYQSWTPPGGTSGDYYAFGGGLRVVKLSGLQGNFRISGRVAFTGNGYYYGPWSDTVLFGVGSVGSAPILGNPEATDTGECASPQWQGITSLGSFIWDWLKFLLIPCGDQFSAHFTGPTGLFTQMAAKWPFSWYFDTIGGVINALAISSEPVCTPTANPTLTNFPNMCWFGIQSRQFYGDWGEQASAAGAWIWCAVEIWRNGKAMLGIDDDEEA